LIRDAVDLDDAAKREALHGFSHCRIVADLVPYFGISDSVIQGVEHCSINLKSPVRRHNFV
jgi:hypothetical protein